MTPNTSGLLSLVERESRPVIESVAAAISAPSGTRFVIARMGHTGSTWLAKLLNSHPDVYCSHEAVAARAYPAKSYTHADILRFLRWLAWDSMHDAYAAIGDVGSVTQGHASGLHGFQTAVLIRHPARVLYSRLANADPAFTDLSTAGMVRQIWGIEMKDYGPLDQFFWNDLAVYAAQLWNVGRLRIIRIEDMADPSVCFEELRHLTGLDYPPALIEHAVRRPVHQRNQQLSIGAILSKFSPRQREWYRLVMREIIPAFGYELESDNSAQAA